MKRFHLGLSFSLVSGLAGVLAACTITTSTPNDGNPALPDAAVTGIDGGAELVNGLPADPGGVLPATALNNLKPAASFSAPLTQGGTVRMTLLGLIDPTTQQPIPFKANESVFLSEDGVVKALRVTQSSKNNNLPFDLTFVVDNSGSMGEEADGIANKIIEFVNVVSGAGANVRVAVVGYDGEVNGGLDFTDAAGVDAYLKREGLTGTSRTVGFAGANAADLEQKALAQAADGGASSSENGIVGVQFAEGSFAFRKEAQRVFINFTDEPTQPGGNLAVATKTLCGRWKPANGTIHTVWSGSNSLAPDGGVTWTENERENPADLSACTPGGVVKTVSPDASDLDLTTLPLTDALKNSALVEYNSADATAPHEVTLVVKNGATADGKTTFSTVRYGGAL
jgi:hypothetical protein